MLLLAGCALRSSAQTTATTAQVTQMLIFRNSGTVQVVAKDGSVRDAYATPADKPPDESDRYKSTNPKPAIAKKTAAASGDSSTYHYVFAGETLKTGKGGSADLALSGGGSVRVEANSEIKLPEKKDGTTQTESLEVLKGKLFFSIDAEALKKRGTQDFRIKTPTAILAVKGTRFFVQSSNDVDTISAHKGEVSVSASGQTQLVDQDNAVSTAGKMLRARQMGDAEKGWQGVYDEIELEHIPLKVLIRDPLHALNYAQGGHTPGQDEIQSEGFFLVARGVRKDGSLKVGGFPNNVQLAKMGDAQPEVSCAIRRPGTSDFMWYSASAAAGISLSDYGYHLNGRLKDLIGLEFWAAGKNIEALKVITVPWPSPSWNALWDAKSPLQPASKGIAVQLSKVDEWVKVQIGLAGDMPVAGQQIRPPMVMVAAYIERVTPRACHALFGLVL
jgi:hypothetical protein